MNLLSYQTFVEAPFIILTIGEYTFGAYKRTQAPDSTGVTYKVTYPNYMESLSIVKINGAIKFMSNVFSKVLYIYSFYLICISL